MKNYTLYLLISITAFFAPIQGLLVAVATSIILDTIMGIYRSVKIKGWKSVTSRKLSEIISKMLLYQMCLISLFIMDKFLLTEFFVHWFSVPFIATKICAIILVFIEMVSIKENFEKATGKDVWLMVKSALGRAKEIKEGINDITD